MTPTEERLLSLLRRYTANDHVHGSGCDELTQEAEDFIEQLEAQAGKD